MPERHELKTYDQFTQKEAKLVDLYTDPESQTYRNKVRSYEAAGYYCAKVPEGQEDDGRAYRAMKVKAHKLFKKDHIWAEVERRLIDQSDALKMPMEEVIAKFSAIADVDLMKYLREVPVACPHCEGELHLGIEYVFDVKQMQKEGYGSLLKKMRPTKYGTEFDFYPADDALDRLMKHYGGYRQSSVGEELSAFDELIIAARKI
jgi:hypothetical protein